MSAINLISLKVYFKIIFFQVTKVLTNEGQRQKCNEDLVHVDTLEIVDKLETDREPQLLFECSFLATAPRFLFFLDKKNSVQSTYLRICFGTAKFPRISEC
jgi:hypothetical protein